MLVQKCQICYSLCAFILLVSNVKLHFPFCSYILFPFFGIEIQFEKCPVARILYYKLYFCLYMYVLCYSPLYYIMELIVLVYNGTNILFYQKFKARQYTIYLCIVCCVATTLRNYKITFLMMQKSYKFNVIVL